MIGNVTVYNSVANEFVGEWIIELDNDNIKHVPKGIDKTLPPICQHEEIMTEVETMVKNYMAGFHQEHEVHKWLKPITTPTSIKKCPHCGNSFYSKQHKHTTCGLD
jgi:hypothetical protein